MTTFWCCDLKDHSYFLLVNFIAMIIFGGVVTIVDLALVAASSSGVVLAFQLVLGLIVLFVLILNIIAFFNYIIWDNLQGGYLKFYANVLFFSSITALGVATIMMIALLATSPNGGHTFLSLIRWIWSIITLGSMIYWSYTLRGIILEEQEEKKAELVENAHAEPKAKSVVDEKAAAIAEP